MFNLRQKMTFFLAFTFRTGQNRLVKGWRYVAPSHISDTTTNTIVSGLTEYTALDFS